MSFVIRRDDRNKGATDLPLSSTAVAVGDLLVLVPGATAWTLAATSSLASYKKAIATGTATTASTSVAGIILDGNELVEADTENTGSSSDNGDLMIVGTVTSGSMTINNTGTTVAATTKEAHFTQYQPVTTGGSTTKILGWVSVGNGTSPAAT